MNTPPATSEIPLPNEQPSLADLLCHTEGAGDIDFEIPEIDDIAQPAVFD